jgi:DNA helicase-2/ATP-dependent DNA helicase PcrA
MGLPKGMDTGSAWGRASAWGNNTTADGINMGRTHSKDAPYVGASETYSSRRTQDAGIEVNGTVYKVGQGVSHARFGEGVITRLQGSGPEAQVQINFSGVGTKTLVLGMAKLALV